MIDWGCLHDNLENIRPICADAPIFSVDSISHFTWFANCFVNDNVTLFFGFSYQRYIEIVGIVWSFVCQSQAIIDRIIKSKLAFIGD